MILRSVRLLSLFPVLVDESIYLRWAEIIHHQGQWFISLLDAKQPLSYWIYATLRMVSDADPLLSARLVSVAAGSASAVCLFCTGRILDSAKTGVIAGFLYAVLPYGLFYDRLAYTDALVNFWGIALTLASLHCFSRPDSGARLTILTGLVLGLGYFTKSTIVLSGLMPLACAISLRSVPARPAAVRLGGIYALAAIFPMISFVMVPQAPTFEVNNLLLHHTSFFATPSELMRDPLTNAWRNTLLAGDYLACYVSAPFAAVALVCLTVCCAVRRDLVPILLAGFVLPVCFVILTLRYFPSRYLFPLVWPLLLSTAIATGAACRRWPRLDWRVAGVAVAAPLLVASFQFLIDPDYRLHPIDAGEFTSSGAFSGYGIKDAVQYLLREAPEDEITVVLTDPVWGTPADAIHAYLNHRRGIRVYDAWWMQLGAGTPILPARPTEVMRSQYERISAGAVNFPAMPHIYYVTDTNYNRPDDVRKRQPGATPAARFAKRNDVDFIDVYRLR